MKGKNFKCRILIMLFIILFIVPPAYAEEVRGVTKDLITIGVIYDQTGPASPLTVPGSKAFKNYFRWVNEKGGINGRKTKLIIEDDRYSIPLDIAAYKKLVWKDKVLLILGPTSSGGMFALTPTIQKDKVPCVFPPFV